MEEWAYTAHRDGKSNDKIDLFFEYCEGQTLEEFQLENDDERGQDEVFVWHVFLQIAEALVFLREYSIFLRMHSRRHHSLILHEWNHHSIN